MDFLEVKTMRQLLSESTPLVSRALFAPWRLVSLAVGLGLLMAGAIFLPSDDWDFPLCFVMGLPAYVLAPWTFRQVFYFRWKWWPVAAFVFWLTVDGTYSLYWRLNDFTALTMYRPANFFYCTPLFWISGLLWNLELTELRWRWTLGGARRVWGARTVRMMTVLVVALGITHFVGLVTGLEKLVIRRFSTIWLPIDVRIEMDQPSEAMEGFCEYKSR